MIVLNVDCFCVALCLLRICPLYVFPKVWRIYPLMFVCFSETLMFHCFLLNASLVEVCIKTTSGDIALVSPQVRKTMNFVGFCTYGTRWLTTNFLSMASWVISGYIRGEHYGCSTWSTSWIITWESVRWGVVLIVSLLDGSGHCSSQSLPLSSVTIKPSEWSFDKLQSSGNCRMCVQIQSVIFN